MIIDNNLQLSAAQSVTSSSASTNYIDQGAAGNAYEGLWFVIMTNTTCTDSGSDATVNFALQCDDNSSFSSPKSLFETGALAFSTYATAGTVVCAVEIPKGAERYIRAYFTVASGPLTAGKFDAFFTKDIPMGGSMGRF